MTDATKLFLPLGDEATINDHSRSNAEKRMVSFGDQELMARWEGDLESIAAEIHWIWFRREVFVGLLDEIQRVGGEGYGLLHPAVSTTYVQAQSVAIRRLIDHDTRARSFVTLLEEMECKAALFTRVRFQNLYETAAAPDWLADEMFNRIAGEDGEFQRSVHGPGHDDRCC